MADMIEKTKSTTTSTAFGKKLDTPLPYDYAWSEYPDFATLQAAKDELTNDEQVKTRNNERMSNARQKALAAALKAAGYEKPTAENDPQVRLRDMFKTLQTAKNGKGERLYTDEKAREIAATTLQLEWEEE